MVVVVMVVVVMVGNYMVVGVVEIMVDDGGW